MSFKGKTVVVVLALAAASLVSAVGASATTGGHFVSEVEHTTLSGSASGAHTTAFSFDENTPIVCASASYSGTASEATVAEVGLTPAYSNCNTEESESSVSIDVNGCNFALRIGKRAGEDNTTDLVCPSEKKLELTHPNCTFAIPPQTFQEGTAYTASMQSGKAALTLDWTATMTAHYEGGICVFLGTKHTGTLSGSLLLTGKDTAGSTVGIEATGSEDGRFRYESTHTAVTGTQTTASNTTFGVLLGSVECSTATLDGTTAVSANNQITGIPAYSGCEGSGREVTTHTNGCAYIVTVGESSVSGQVHIECPSGKSIETTIDKFPEGCTITIPAQTAGGVVDYGEKGEGTGRDLLLTWTLEGLHYTRDGCEVGGTGNNGTMGGSITLSGEDTSGNPKGIWIE